MEIVMETPKSQESALGDAMSKAVALVIDKHYIGSSKSLSKDEFEAGVKDKAWASASKVLFWNKALNAIWNLDVAMDARLKTYCLPSPFKRGIYLLPVSLVPTVDQLLVEHSAARQSLVQNEFRKSYEPSILEAKEALGPRFNPADYLTLEEAVQKFSYNWSYKQFGVSEALKEISTEMFKREQEKAAAQWVEIDGAIRSLLRASMKELVDHMVERLTPNEDGKKKIFKKNSLQNIQDFLSTFSARDLTNDAELQKVVEQVRKLTEGLPADQVRTDEALRDSLQKGFSDIKQQMENMITLAPSRKIVFEE